MKKILALLLALSLCLGMSMCAYAEEAEEPVSNETETVSDEEAAATDEKEAADAAGDEAKSRYDYLGEKIHFVPQRIIVAPNRVEVQGYFINLNSDYAVGNFENFKMDVYQGRDLLVSGHFGTVNRFILEPFGTKYQTFIFNGRHRLNNGKYACDDRTHCVCSYRFTCYSR